MDCAAYKRWCGGLLMGCYGEYFSGGVVAY
jgi:hypothetical protein